MPWSTVHLEKLIDPQLVKNFPMFYRPQRFITAFTIVHHLSLSWARCIIVLVKMWCCVVLWKLSILCIIVWLTIFKHFSYLSFADTELWKCVSEYKFLSMNILTLQLTSLLLPIVSAKHYWCYCHRYDNLFTPFVWHTAFCHQNYTKLNLLCSMWHLGEYSHFRKLITVTQR